MTDTSRYLADRQAIVDVGIRYAWAIDRRDDAALRTCFAPDGVLSMLSFGEFVGIEAIAAALSILAALDLTQHVIANQLVAVAGDRATMDSYVVATHLKHDHPGGAVFTAGGAHADEFIRWHGEWRIARRTASLLWTTGNAAMLFPAG